MPVAVTQKPRNFVTQDIVDIAFRPGKDSRPARWLVIAGEENDPAELELLAAITTVRVRPGNPVLEAYDLTETTINVRHGVPQERVLLYTQFVLALPQDVLDAAVQAGRSTK